MSKNINSRQRALGLLTLTTLAFNIAFSVQAHPQIAGGTISGTITDPSGAVIPNAQILIENVGTALTRKVPTNSDGFYSAPDLPPATYEINVSASGFATQVTLFTLTVGAQAQLNMILKVGPSTQQIEVVGGAPSIELANSILGGVVNATTVRELPLNGRSWTDLAALQTGVSQPNTQVPFSNGRGQRGFGTQVSISGTRPDQNNYRLDGITVNDYANNGPGDVLGAALGVDAIQEFSVLTQTYSAQYGRASGGIINAVTRSGTNSFHGDVYEFLRNDALDARNFFDGAKKPPFRRNQFGAAAGGPIQKDRTFVFGDYEGLRHSLGVTTVNTVLSTAARNGRLSTGNVSVDPAITKVLNAFYPLPNGPLAANGDTGIYTFAGKQILNEDFVTTKLDRKISEKDSLSGTYLFDNASLTQPDEFNAKLMIFADRRQTVALEETHLFDPQLFNSFRLGFNRVVAAVGADQAINPLVSDISLGTIPGRPAALIQQVPGVTNFSGGLGGQSLYRFHYNSYQAYDDLLLAKGVHSLKLGGMFERDQDNNFASVQRNGLFRFGTLKNFLTNRPNSLTVALPNLVTPRNVRQSIMGIYFQDDLRWRPNLTVNLGVRYEIATVPTEMRGKLSVLRALTDAQPHLGDPFFSNPTLRNLEPRLGFSWDPFRTSKTAVRGGFGIFDMLPLAYETELDFLLTAPFYSQASASGLPAGTYPSAGYAFVASSQANLRQFYLDPAPRRNYVMQWNLNIQHEVVRNVTAMISYVGSRSRHLPIRIDDTNVVLPTLTPQGYLWPSPIGSGNRLNPNAGIIKALVWQGTSSYDALQLEVKKLMSHGLQARGSYTWSKNIDTGSASLASDAFQNSVTSPFLFDLRLNRGLSDFDIGQNLVVSFIWEVPSRKSSSRVAEWLLNGWELGSIYKASSGVPFTVRINGDPLGLRNTDPFDAPNLVASSQCRTPVNPGNVNNYIKTQCFTFPVPANLRGNAGRNRLIAPGLSNLDLSVFKNNRISERINAQFRVEFFNSLNHANFSPPFGNTAVFDQQGNPIPTAGKITSTQTAARDIQLALKVIW